jgi:hypothetical protein
MGGVPLGGLETEKWLENRYAVPAGVARCKIQIGW